MLTRTQIKSSVDIGPLLDIAGDCFHFVTEFFEVISTSATHIYNSALALTPKTSILRRLYSRFVHPSPRVVAGLPASWDPRIASVTLSTQYPDLAWSPSSRSVAVSTSTGVEIRDSTTLEKLSALKSPMSLSHSAVAIAYSPNGRLLACACTRPFSFEIAIAIWDIQTGGIVKAIHGGEPGYPRSMLYSSDGRMLSVACGTSPYRWTVCAFDTASGERVSSDEMGSEFDPVFWTKGDSIRFATSYRDGDCDLCIDTWEIRSTSGGHPTKLDSFRVCHEFNSEHHQIFFSPASLRVAIVSVNSTIIRDARDSSVLLEVPAPRTLGGYAGHFSQDGNLFACAEQQEAQIWKAAPEGYVLWAKFPLRFPAAAGGMFAFSPDLGSIIGWGLGIMEVWKVDRLIKSQAVEQPSDFRNSHLVAFSTNGTHVAIGRASSGIVKVVDLRSGVSELVVNAETEVVDIKMVGDTVVVLGGRRVVSWSLTGRSYEEHGVKRAGLDESLKIIEVFSEYHLDPRLLDDQCQKAVFTRANIMVFSDANTGVCLMESDPLERFREPRFSPDGQQLWIPFVRSKYDYWYDYWSGDDEREVDEDDEKEADEDDERETDEGDEREADESDEREADEVYEEDGDEGDEDSGDEGDEDDWDEGESKLGIDEGSGVLGILDDEEPERGFEIVEGEETGQITLMSLPEDTQPPDYPWKSSKGYRIDGLTIQWVLDRDGKRLLWLPPHWRTTYEKTWRWNGDFLVLRNSALPEPVIVQLSLE